MSSSALIWNIIGVGNSTSVWSLVRGVGNSASMWSLVEHIIRHKLQNVGVLEPRIPFPRSNRFFKRIKLPNVAGNDGETSMIWLFWGF